MKWGQNQPKTTFPIFYMYNEGICVIWQKSLKKTGRFRFFQKMGKHRIQVLRLSLRGKAKLENMKKKFNNERV